MEWIWLRLFPSTLLIVVYSVSIRCLLDATMQYHHPFALIGAIFSVLAFWIVWALEIEDF